VDGWAFTSLPTTSVINNGHGSLVFLAVVFFSVTIGHHYRQPFTVDDKSHPITMRLPRTFLSPPNEWYIWKPSPRLNKDVKVLLSLSPTNYPLGFKDTLEGGDLPIVWTNTQYRMLYINMGHGDKIFASETQNQLFEEAILWLGAWRVNPKR
jgi:type 1 glutamine amidotransferase